MSAPEPIVGESPEQALVRLSQQRATGALEALDGKRRRRFFLREGELVQTTSNLKKEQIDQLPASLMAGSQEQTSQHLAAVRLAAVIAEPIEALTWQPGEVPGRELPCRLAAVVWEALDLGLGLEGLLARPPGRGGAHPVCRASNVEDLAVLALPPEHREWLLTLDGFRSLEELARFGPGEPRACAASVCLAAIYGVVELREAAPERVAAGAFDDQILEEGPGTAAEDEAWLADAEGIDPDAAPGFGDLSSFIAASVRPREGEGGASPAREDEHPAGEPASPVAEGGAGWDEEPDTDMEMQIDLDPEERDLLPGEPSAPPSGDEAFEEDGHEVSFASGVPSVPRGPDEPPEPSDPLLEAAEAAVRAEVARIEKAENAFSVLGLEPGADVEVLRGAYFKIARQLHPDRVGADREDLREKAAAAFDKARAAWEEVKDEERRLQLVDRLVHGKKTEEEEALEAVQEILATERLIDRGLAQFRSGRLVQAYELFQQAQEKAAGIKEFKSSDLGIYLGYLTWRLQLGRDDEAAERGFNMLQDALNEAQRHQDGWVLLGRILKERGSADEARRCFIRALKINPENKDAFREMDRMKKEKEEAEQAGKGFLARLFSRKKGKEKEKKEE